MTNLALRFAGRSEIGLVRKNNEDSGYVSGDLAVVADGMGGHEAGELASAATVASVVNSAKLSALADEVLTHLAEAVIVAGEYIADVVSGNRELTGMGTTMTAVAVRGELLAVAHVGDSRAYLMRDGEFQQITKDHTFVQTLVDAGEITKAEAANHPRRNLMMRAIDGIHAVDVDLSVREAKIGDRLLLCSDGLCGVVSEEEIRIALGAADLTNAVTELIDSAIACGAPDNVTVIVADLIEAGLEVDPVVIGAAADLNNQVRLPAVEFPDEQIEETDPTKIYYPVVKRNWLFPIISTLLAMAIGISGALFWLSNQWFVGVFAPTGEIATFQGISTSGLNRVIEVSQFTINDLPEFEKAQIEKTIDAPTHDEELAILNNLQISVDDCKLYPQTPGCPGSSQ
jgi:protein phosphatase